MRELTDKAAADLIRRVRRGENPKAIAKAMRQWLLESARQAGVSVRVLRVDEDQLVQALIDNGLALPDQTTILRHVANGLNPRTGTPAYLLTFMRTEQMDIYRRATLAAYRASGVVTGWQWEASLDDRVCLACAVMDGSTHDLSETGPDGHPNCRCAAIPIVRDELMIPADRGENWISRQSPDRLRSLMGPTRLEQYKNGTPLTDFITRRRSPGWRDYVTVRAIMKS